MSDTAMRADTERPNPLFECTLNRSFNAAHLLTASVRQAEAAVLKAIDSFDPNLDTEEGLFRHALRAAVESPAGHQSDSVPSPMPAELQAVLNLARDLRHCFVLCILIGIPKQACAQLLGMSVQMVDRYTCTALQRLAGFAQG